MVVPLEIPVVAARAGLRALLAEVRASGVPVEIVDDRCRERRVLAVIMPPPDEEAP
jgi:hypothetical protein